MSTDRLVIERTYWAYDSFCRRDLLAFYSTKATYCHLGLLVAAVLFAPTTSDVVLNLEHPASDIRRVVLRRNDAVESGYPGYHAQPLVLNYYPQAVVKHPWEPYCGNPRDLPGFFLTNVNELVTTDRDWEKRDTLVGFGSDRGMARLVDLLLNVSRSASEILEVELEGEGGFRGVAPFSCNVRLWLPGAFGWNDNLWTSESIPA